MATHTNLEISKITEPLLLRTVSILAVPSIPRILEISHMFDLNIEHSIFKEFWDHWTHPKEFLEFQIKFGPMDFPKGFFQNCKEIWDRWISPNELLEFQRTLGPLDSHKGFFRISKKFGAVGFPQRFFLEFQGKSGPLDFPKGIGFQRNLRALDFSKGFVGFQGKLRPLDSTKLSV